MTSISHTRIIRNLNFWWSPPRRLLLLVAGALIRYTLLSQSQQMHSFYVIEHAATIHIPFLLHQPTTLLLNWIAEINKQISWLWLKTQNKGNKHSNFLITIHKWVVRPSSKCYCIYSAHHRHNGLQKSWQCFQLNYHNKLYTFLGHRIRTNRWEFPIWTIFPFRKFAISSPRQYQIY